MTIKSLLQGTWLGHPLHPALVHLPTGLWPAAVVFDLLALRDDRAMAFAAFWCIALGLLAAASAVPTGLADWIDIKPEKPARRVGLYHMIINVLVALLMAISLTVRVRNGGWMHAPVAPAALALGIIAVAMLFVSGYLGGRMTFNHGISVARISKKRWRAIAEAGGANLPPEKE